jgi:NAD(P)H-dependent flavin oxidoreductase YrpB (nitropropane dioxygenase family)
MGRGIASPRLAAAVANAGGLGMVSVYGDGYTPAIEALVERQREVALEQRKLVLTPDEFAVLALTYALLQAGAIGRHIRLADVTPGAAANCQGDIL